MMKTFMAIEAGPELVSECDQDQRPRIQGKHGQQHRHGGAVGEQLACVLPHLTQPRCGAARRMGVSRTGRFTIAANTPRTIAMYQTMS